MAVRDTRVCLEAKKAITCDHILGTGQDNVRGAKNRRKGAQHTNHALIGALGGVGADRYGEVQ